MDNKFVIELKKEIKTILMSRKPDIIQPCLEIINYVSIAPERKMHLSFQDLYRVCTKVSENDFYDAVFFLTRKKTAVLTQNFEALHPRLGYKAVPNREEILQAMRDDDLYNPFTGDELTEDEFGEQVLTYFTPSSDFMRLLND